jgi:hypothetical protein
MPAMLLRFGQMLMLVVLFAAAGGHWMALQSLAWTQMLVSYSQDGPLLEAVAKTFDGQHPCTLCKKIERARRSQPVSRTIQQDSQASFLAPPVLAVAKGEGMSWKMEIPQRSARQRSEPPIAPPPRGAVA